ncbi:hypothetical protein ScalyP_jg10997 [Parmales sp. scaly parma]|nr:hypothetical protein ScalyP_jg10997 [Parmales sp. scaly parma]
MLRLLTEIDIDVPPRCRMLRNYYHNFPNGNGEIFAPHYSTVAGGAPPPPTIQDALNWFASLTLPKQQAAIRLFNTFNNRERLHITFTETICGDGSLSLWGPTLCTLSITLTAKLGEEEDRIRDLFMNSVNNIRAIYDEYFTETLGNGCMNFTVKSFAARVVLICLSIHGGPLKFCKLIPFLAGLIVRNVWDLTRVVVPAVAMEWRRMAFIYVSLFSAMKLQGRPHCPTTQELQNAWNGMVMWEKQAAIINFIDADGCYLTNSESRLAIARYYYGQQLSQTSPSGIYVTFLRSKLQEISAFNGAGSGGTVNGPYTRIGSGVVARYKVAWFHVWSIAHGQLRAFLREPVSQPSPYPIGTQVWQMAVQKIQHTHIIANNVPSADTKRWLRELNG